MKIYVLFVAVLALILSGCRQLSETPDATAAITKSAPTLPASQTVDTVSTVMPTLLVSATPTAEGIVPVSEKVAEFEGIRATLSYSETQSFIVDLTLQIVRYDQVVYNDKVSLENDDVPWLGGTPTLYNLDADAEIEVVLQLAQAGAHCCSFTVIYDYNPVSGSYTYTRQSWGNYRNLPDFVDVNEDGQVELVNRDEAFSSEFGPFPISGAAPIQVWEYAADGMQDVTRSFPELVRQDAENWWRAYTDEESDWFGYPIALSAYVADLCILGEEANAWDQVKAAYENRVWGEPWDVYLEQLTRTLKVYGYLPE
jgi:hypothetical protein